MEISRGISALSYKNNYNSECSVKRYIKHFHAGVHPSRGKGVGDVRDSFLMLSNKPEREPTQTHTGHPPVERASARRTVASQHPYRPLSGPLNIARSGEWFVQSPRLGVGHRE